MREGAGYAQAVMTRVGFIGSGSVAERHARTLRGFEGVDVVAVTSEHLPRAREFAEDFSARAYQDVGRLLDEANCDVIYICVPPDAHGAYEELVIEAGLPFFVEKPLAHDLATAERIAAALERRPVLTATGYQWRYSGSVERAGALLEEHPPVLATAQWLDRTPPPAWWRDRTRSGGQVIEQATHLLDTLRVLLGEAEVHGAAEGPAVQGGRGVARAVVAALRFRSGVVASLTCTPAFKLEQKHVAIDLVCGDLWIRVHEDRLERLDGGAAEVWKNERDAKELVDRAFIDEVRGDAGARIRAPYAEALKTHRLAWAVTRAAGVAAVPARLPAAT
jgi:myo-inositol 2-dehydrogenase / D-chiro-inositol 1-dehydrogenase